MPRRVFFPGMKPEERVVLFLRRHWSIVVRLILFYLFLGLIPVVLGLLAVRYTTVLDDPTALIYTLFILAASIYELLILTLFFRAWIDYYLDVWVVTDERIVNIEQHGLFHRTVSEQRLSRVQDVTHEVQGLLPTFLRYGEVFVQTAGQAQRFVFEQVPHPDRVAKTILEIQEQYFAKHGEEEATKPREQPLQPHKDSPAS